MTRRLYCRCVYANVVPKGTKDEVLAQLSASGLPFEAVPDLCELSARKDPALRELADAARSGTLRIAACHERAVKWLFAAAGAPLPECGWEVHNMRDEPADTISLKMVGDAG